MNKFITLLAFSVFSMQANADCTYNQAQKKLLEVNNMTQVYNREMATHVEKGQESPPQLEAKRQAIAEEQSKINILLEQEYEKNPDIQANQQVNPDICKRYEAMLIKHKPEGYQGMPVKTGMLSAGGNCDTNSLWTRYGASIQKQADLVKSGKITKPEVGTYMKLSTQIGELATTDIAQACKVLDQYEKKLNAE